MSAQTLSTADRTNDSLHVLLIEDSAEDAFAVGRSLARATRPVFRLQTAPSWSAGRTQLESAGADVVLLDLHLPDADGLDLVRDVVRVGSGVPIVILTGIDDDHVALEALALGAQDYLVKSDIGTSTLRRSICHAIERQQILESLEQAHLQRLQMRDEFLSHVSHELLTPLSAIYQFVEILDATIGDGSDSKSEQQRMCADVLLRNAVQLRRMIADLMEATRLDTGKLRLDLAVLELGDPIELAVQSAEPEARRKGLELVSECSADLPMVIADESRVRQIVGNLLSNAIKFTPSGGTVTVRAARWRRDPGYAHVCVEDTGYGISAEALPHIFNRLYQDHRGLTASRKGLGIGLYICREVVHSMDGEIWVESRAGSGSCFHFTLPVHSTERLLQSRIDLSRPASLVVVTLQDDERVDEGAAEVLASAAAEIQGMLPRLVWEQCDTVLPRQSTPQGAELLALVAQTDTQGAHAMCLRIEAAVTGVLASLGGGCRATVRSHPLHTPGASPTSMGEIARKVECTLDVERSELGRAGGATCPSGGAPGAQDRG